MTQEAFHYKVETEILHRNSNTDYTPLSKCKLKIKSSNETEEILVNACVCVFVQSALSEFRFPLAV